MNDCSSIAMLKSSLENTFDVSLLFGVFDRTSPVENGMLFCIWKDVLLVRLLLKWFCSQL